MPEIEYTLTREQVKEGLYLCGALKSRKVINIVETAVLGALMIATIISIIMNPANKQNYFILAVLAFMLIMVLVFSGKQEKDTLDSAVNGCKIRLTLDEQFGSITVFIEETNAQWVIDNSVFSRLFESNNLFVILLKDSRIMIIPKIAASTETLEVLNRITSSLTINTQKKIGENIE